MKRRIYLITALALINIIVMKYQELRKEQKESALSVTIQNSSADSLLRLPSQ